VYCTVVVLTPVAFLSLEDLKFQLLDSILIVIVDFLNKDGGGIFVIAPESILPNDNISLNEESNQKVIRLAIFNWIRESIGEDFTKFVIISFETQEDKPNKKHVHIKVKKSDKAAKIKKHDHNHNHAQR
jgi:hypothetical protein